MMTMIMMLVILSTSFLFITSQHPLKHKFTLTRTVYISLLSIDRWIDICVFGNLYIIFNPAFENGCIPFFRCLSAVQNIDEKKPKWKWNWKEIPSQNTWETQWRKIDRKRENRPIYSPVVLNAPWPLYLSLSRSLRLSMYLLFIHQNYLNIWWRERRFERNENTKHLIHTYSN